MRRDSGLILMILKSYSLPGSSGPALFSGPLVVRFMPMSSLRPPRRSSISVLWQSPSMLSPSSTNAPNMAMRETLPFTICPTLCCLNQSPQMSLTCFMPSDTRRPSGSTRNTLAVTGSPFLKTSWGFLMRSVQLTSLTCTRPSKPSSISTKAPNSTMLRTLPVTTVPTGYFSAVSSQGSGWACFMPSETRRSLGLMSSTTTSTSSQAFDPVLQLDEGSVVHHSHYAALVPAARRVALRGADPGIRGELLQAQGDALLLLVKLEDDQIQFLVRLHHVRRVLDAPPAEIGEVQQAVDAPQVHEGPVLGDVLHRSVHRLALGQRLHQLG